MDGNGPAGCQGGKSFQENLNSGSDAKNHIERARCVREERFQASLNDMHTWEETSEKG